MTKEEAIKHLHTYSSTNGSGLTTQDQHEEAKKMAIKALETQLRWIPCSEQLPKVRQDVLMQFEQNIAVGFLSHGNWNVNTGNGLYTGILESDDQPIAWMPLQKPWEGGQDGV